MAVYPLRPEINLLDGQFYAADPFPHFAWMRAHAPVFRDEANALWGVTRHADVMQV